VGILVRLRSDREFHRTVEPLSGKRGRPSKYGQRFACKDEQTRGAPDEGQEFEDERSGKVCLERWQSLQDKRTPNLTFDVLRAQAHLEKEKPPPAVWFAWLPPFNPPDQIALTAQTIWTAYVSRWPIEPSLRFHKETLGWTLPRFHSAATGDTWPQLVALAHLTLFLSRPIVQDNTLPWQKAQTNLTPQRVRQSLSTFFLQIGTPPRPPKPRGKSPGWQKGRRRMPKTRHNVVKKNASATQTT